MAEPIVMPSYGMYTAEGTLVAWLAAHGASVAAGQVIAEIETDKAVEEVPAPAGGVLHHVLAAGARLAEQDLMGYVLAAGEAPPGAAVPAASAPTAKGGESVAPPQERSDAVPAAAGRAPEVKASPLAKRLAREHGLELARLRGSGPQGRIVEADVLAAVASRTPPSALPAVARREPLSNMRRSIGERLRDSLHTAVSLTLTREVNADVLVRTRHELSAPGGEPIPFDAFFVKILAEALREHPALNGTVDQGELVTYAEVHIGVAIDLPGGLIAPVVRDADTRSLPDVARQIRDFATRARSGQIQTQELVGGTSIVTNLGGLGVDAFTPVLSPGQACILGIGRIRQQPVVREGNIQIGSQCILSLTFDHRVTDGAPAARLLDAIDRKMNDAAGMAAWGERL